MNFAGVEFVPEQRLTDLEARHAALKRLYDVTKAERDRLKVDNAAWRRDAWQWPICLAVGMVGMFLFGIWLAGKANQSAPPQTVKTVSTMLV
jgi:hypothetical protein